MSALPSNNNDAAPLEAPHREGLSDKTILQKYTSQGSTKLRCFMQPFSQEALDLFTAQFAIRGATRARSSGLGDLNKVPGEILTMILLELDIMSLIRFSHVSSMTRALVQQVPEFRLVTKHAGTTAFMGIIATRLSNYYSLTDLSTALTTSKCFLCPCNGELVYLPTLQRCCVKCLEDILFEPGVTAYRLRRRTERVSPRIPILVGPLGRGNHQVLTVAIFPIAQLRQMTGGERTYPVHANPVKPAQWAICQVPRVSNPWNIEEPGSVDTSDSWSWGSSYQCGFPYQGMEYKIIHTSMDMD